MMRLLCLLALIGSASAAAQDADPALDALDAAPQGPSELDELSQGETDGDFPDIDTVEARKPVTVTLRALDKIIAKYTDITVAINEQASFGSLTITPRTCDKRPPEEFPETTAFLEIVDSTPVPASNLKIVPPKKKSGKVASEPAPASASAPAGVTADNHRGAVSPAAPVSAAALPSNMVFSGWMFASSPGLSALQHPVYDVWVIDCKTVKAGS